MPQKFTTRFVESLKPTINEQTYADSDSALSIRALQSGAYYFFRHKRFGKKQIGRVGTISLAEARAVANDYESLTRRGIIPKQTTNEHNPTLLELYESYVESNHFYGLSEDYRKLFQSRCRKYLLKKRRPHRHETLITNPPRLKNI